MADLGLATPPTPAQAIAPPAPPADPKPDRPSQPGMVERMIGSLGSGVKEAVRENKALDAQTMKLTPPELKLPPKPEFKNTDPMEAWGSVAMVFAALASSRVRNHASTAMNAAAAALKGIQQQDKDAFDRSFKTWELESKNAIEVANFQQRAYDELLHHYEHRETMNMEAGKALDAAEEAKLHTLTIALGDPGPWIAYGQNGLAGALDYVKQAQKHKEDFEIRMEELKLRGSKAGSALAMAELAKTDAWKSAKTDMERLELMKAAGIDAEHIILALQKDETQRDIAGAKNATANRALDIKGDEFNKRFGLDARKEDDKVKLGEAGLDIRRGVLGEKGREFDVTEGRKEGEDAFAKLKFSDQLALKKKEDEEKQSEAEKRLSFLEEKLRADTERGYASIEERAKSAFDRVSLGRDVLGEHVRKDVSDEEWRKYKLGETEKEYEERMGLDRDRFELEKGKDEERKKEFREKMDLELKKFDEKSSIDAARVGIAKEKLASVETGKTIAPVSPEEEEDFAHLMADVKMQLPNNYQIQRDKTGTWARIKERAYQIAHENGKDDFSDQWYPALMAQRKDAGSGQASKGIRYLSVANKHLEAMEAAVMALPNDSDLKGLTRVFNFVSNQVNDSNLAAEQVDGQIVANEVAKAISGAGNLTGDERHELNSMFDAARGKASILNIIHHARELLGGQAGGYVKQFSHYGDAADVTGMDPEAAKSFFINPKTGETDEALVKWDRARIAATLAGQKPPPMPGAGGAPAAPAAGGEWKFEQKAEYNGKPVGVKDGKWVYEDGSPVEGQ